MTIQNSTLQIPCIEYRQLPWGDLITGTKEQLQGLGLAVGMAFPGEEGGPKRNIKVIDPRGYKCNISEWYNNGISVFHASIPLPGRDRPEDKWSVFSPGVRLYEGFSTNDYIGTADALESAGLLRLDQLPGKPGMRKTTVTILPDGTTPQGAPTAYCSEARATGAKSIKRASKTTYKVSITVDEDEKERRYIAHNRRQDEWESRMMAMPRPAPLNAPLSEFAKNEKRRVVPKCRIVGNVIYLPRS